MAAHNGDGLLALTHSTHDPFAGASLALSPMHVCVCLPIGKGEGFRHSVSESACNGVDAFLIARRSWMW